MRGFSFTWLSRSSLHRPVYTWLNYQAQGQYLRMSSTNVASMPYQCVVKCGSKLVAARGSSIDSFNIRTGLLLSSWECPALKSTEKENGTSKQPEGKEVMAKSELREQEGAIEEPGPPAKKRKLSDDPELKEEQEQSKKSEARGGKREKRANQNNRSVAKSSGLEAPAVIALAATEDGRHVIAVTGEDKSIRVFESTEGDGLQKLNQISQR